jgi:hypothetical protein
MITDKIGPHHLERGAIPIRRGAARLRPSFETARDCVVAGRHADALHQPFTRAAADAMAEKISEFARPSGAARSRGRDLSGGCSKKVLRLHAPFRHRQRWRRSFTVTVEPCAGKSCR